MGQLRPPVTSLTSELGDAAQVYSARAALDPLLHRLRAAPLDPAAVASIREWLDVDYPPAAAALHRIQTSPGPDHLAGLTPALSDSGPGEQAGAQVAPAPTMLRPVRTSPAPPPLTKPPLTPGQDDRPAADPAHGRVSR